MIRNIIRALKLRPHQQRVCIFTSSEGEGGKRNHYNSSDQSDRAVYGSVAAFSVVVLAYAKHKSAECKKRSSKQDVIPGELRPDLPTYTMDTVSEHYDPSISVWVTYKLGVYDITKFLKLHPGDDKILMAAGGQIDPFWSLYPIHQNLNVYETLEEYRIGNIDESELPDSSNFNDVFINQPKQKSNLILRSSKPYNGETPPHIITSDFITPIENFYVRSHFAVPPLFTSLNFIDLKEKTTVIDIKNLKKDFQEHTIIAALQCCGNRRSEMHAFKEVKGGTWASGSIGCAKWTGVKLADVLNELGVDENDPKLKHVIFEGLDNDGMDTSYATSIPIEMAMDPRRDILLCTEMNDVPLPRSHGGPIRLVVPGVIGARQVKWVKKIILSEVESNSHWQKKDYKAIPNSAPLGAIIDTQTPIYSYPVQSSICIPQDGDVLKAGVTNKVKVEGYAWSGGGRGIQNVEISLNGGETWEPTVLTQVEQPYYRRWAWSLYRTEIEVKGDKGETIEIIARAIDDSFCSQPSNTAWIWNQRGLLHHTIPKCVLHFQ